MITNGGTQAIGVLLRIEMFFLGPRLRVERGNGVRAGIICRHGLRNQSKTQENIVSRAQN